MKPMQAKDQEIRAFALSRLMAGESHRKTIAAVEDTFGQSLSLSTLNEWAHQDPEQAHDISQAHLRAIGHQRIRIAHKAGEMVEEAIDNGTIPPGQKAIVYGVASDKLDSMLKITQDEKKQNSQVDIIRAQLRQKAPHELRAMADALPDPSPPPPTPSPTEIKRYHGLDSA
jgi:hypothetical protein